MNLNNNRAKNEPAMGSHCERAKEQRRDHYVYALIVMGAPVYIGMGKGRRIHHHIRDARNGRAGSNPAKHAALVKYLTDGIEVVPTKLHENLTRAEAWAKEAELIAHYGRIELGGILLNATAGGFSGRDPVPSTRAKMSAIARNRPPERIAVIVAASVNARRGKKLSREHVAKCAAANRGSKRTAAARARISEATRNPPPELRARRAAFMRGRKLSPETCAKISARTISVSTRQKMSASRRGKKQSPEHVAARAAAHRGRKNSAETRAKMSEAALRRPPPSLEERKRLSVLFCGRKHTDATRQKIAETMRKHRASQRAASEGQQLSLTGFS